MSREDGYRILVSRYKPKGFDKPFEPWSIWVPSLAPNRKLHNQWQNKEISLEEFKSRYLEEMKKQEEKIRYYAEHSRVQRVTLVCSCKDKDRCHTSLLKTLMEKVK
ncbi:MAG: hypothetical protein A2252_09250 [Elusimicrobia bacterium RIFOXYA2_FULL_39_19]|nr:MAG: hypothetical protein A2252_09250 [Elusimicrobia bacterium RIFOXYA2_FULL_39_19]